MCDSYGVHGRWSLHMNLKNLRTTKNLTQKQLAEKMKTIGINGVDHHGLALIDPKMNPT